MKDIPDDIDLSAAYAKDNPKPKIGRPPGCFPSGKTMAEVAEEMFCCVTQIRRWCLGMQITQYRKSEFYRLSGFRNDQHFRKWQAIRNRVK